MVNLIDWFLCFNLCFEDWLLLQCFVFCFDFVDYVQCYVLFGQYMLLVVDLCSGQMIEVMGVMIQLLFVSVIKVVIVFYVFVVLGLEFVFEICLIVDGLIIDGIFDGDFIL